MERFLLEFLGANPPSNAQVLMSERGLRVENMSVVKVHWRVFELLVWAADIIAHFGTIPAHEGVLIWELHHFHVYCP